MVETGNPAERWRRHASNLALVGMRLRRWLPGGSTGPVRDSEEAAKALYERAMGAPMNAFALLPISEEADERKKPA